MHDGRFGFIDENRNPFIIGRNGTFRQLSCDLLRILLQIALDADFQRAVGAEKLFQMRDIVILEHLALVDDHDAPAECIHITHIVRCQNDSCMLLLIERVNQRPDFCLH